MSQKFNLASSQVVILIPNSSVTSNSENSTRKKENPFPKVMNQNTNKVSSPVESLIATPFTFSRSKSLRQFKQKKVFKDLIKNESPEVQAKATHRLRSAMGVKGFRMEPFLDDLCIFLNDQRKVDTSPKCESPVVDLESESSESESDSSYEDESDEEEIDSKRCFEPFVFDSVIPPPEKSKIYNYVEKLRPVAEEPSVIRRRYKKTVKPFRSYSENVPLTGGLPMNQQRTRRVWRAPKVVKDREPKYMRDYYKAKKFNAKHPPPHKFPQYKKVDSPPVAFDKVYRPGTGRDHVVLPPFPPLKMEYPDRLERKPQQPERMRVLGKGSKRDHVIGANGAKDLIMTYGKKLPPRILKDLQSKAGNIEFNPAFESKQPSPLTMWDHFYPKSKSGDSFRTIIGPAHGPSEAISFIRRAEKNPVRQAEAISILRGANPLKNFNAWLRRREPTYTFPLPPLPSPPPSTYLRSANKVVDQAGTDPVLSDVLDLKSPFLSLTALFVSIYDASTWKGVVSSLYLYIDGMYPFLKEFLSVEIKNLAESVLLNTMGFRDQAGLSFKDLADTTSGFFLKTDIGSQLGGVLSSVSAVGLLIAIGMNQSSLVEARVNFLRSVFMDPKNRGIESFCRKVLRLCGTFLTRAMSALRTGDYSMIFGATLPAEEWLALSNAYISRPEIIYDSARTANTVLFNSCYEKGEYPTAIHTQLTRECICEELDSLNAMFASLALVYGDDIVIMNGLKSQVSRNKSWIMDYRRDIVNGHMRVTPMVFFIPGDPGIGKTSIVTHLHVLASRVIEEIPNPANVFRYLPGLNFQDSYRPNQWFFFADDIDTNPNLVPGNDHVRVAIDYINSAPLMIESASLDTKGKNWANFTFGAWTTNRIDAGLKGLTTSPLSFWRRFPYKIGLKPKLEYSMGDNGSIRVLDSVNIPPGEDELWEEIILMRVRPDKFDLSVHGGPYELEKVFSGLTPLRDFLVHLHPIMARWIEKQKERLVPLDYALRCDYCGLASHGPCGPRVPHQPSLVVNQALVEWDPARSVLTFMNFLQFTLLAFHTWCCILSYDTFKKAVNYLHFQAVMARVKYNLKTFARKYDVKRILVVIGMMIMALKAGSLYFSRDKYNDQGEEEDAKPPLSFLFPSQQPWSRVPVKRTYNSIPEPGYNLATFKNMVRENLVMVRYKGKRVVGIDTGRGWILTVRHILGINSVGAESVLDFGHSMEVSRGTEKCEFLLVEERVMCVESKDQVLIWVNGLVPKPGVWKRITGSQANAKLLTDKAFLLTPDTEHEGVAFTSNMARTVVTRFLWRYSFPTIDGDCGSPLIGVFGSKFALIGMHTCWDGNNSQGIAEDIDGSTLNILISSNPKQLPLINQALDLVPIGSNPSFGDLPLKSSLWVALSNPQPPSCQVFGTLKDFSSGRFKTSVVDMPCLELWKDLSYKICGKEDYFVAPNPKGKMVDGNWVDPFTVNLDGASNKGGSLELWKLAVDDYLDGVENLIGLDAVCPLSEYEALVGVSGTDMGRVDLNTSFGPPYSRPKKHFMSISVDGELEVSQVLREQLDTLQSILERGEAVSPTAIHVLKDEAISEAKQEALKIRVFNVLSCAYNAKLKQYFGPISCFMRRHPFYFESAIGMDVTSHHWSALVEWLTIFPKFGSGDNSFFDVKQSTDEWFAVIDVIMGLAQRMSYSEMDLVVLRGLLIGCGYVTRVIKGDVFQTSYMMPTGFWLTIFANGIRNSLQRRYAFYYLRPCEEVGRFREGIRQITLGDDNLYSTRFEWFNQVAIQVAFKEFGAVLTSADKKDVIDRFDPFEKLTFLKRSFRRSGGVWYAPIELKSLIRMAFKRVKSKVLSETDQISTIYANILSEAFMHGEEVFNDFAKVVDEVAERLQLSECSSYIRKDFLAYEKLYLEGKMSVWRPNIFNE